MLVIELSFCSQLWFLPEPFRFSSLFKQCLGSASESILTLRKISCRMNLQRLQSAGLPLAKPLRRSLATSGEAAGI
jgi:hypothetical protein